MKRRLMLLVAMLLLAGCAVNKPPVIKYELVEIKVPIRIKAPAPPELLAKLEVVAPLFIEPTDPEASSALSQEGEKKLKQMLNEYYDRELAWRTWSTVR